MSGRLQLRRGVVVAEAPLAVEVDGERRPAWADEGLVGEVRLGDEVLINVAAVELGLGSGGFDVVHANLSRGLSGAGAGDAHVVKLNYTSLQHAVEPVERGVGDPRSGRRSVPVLVLPLHGHLAPAAWAAAQVAPGSKVGYVQTGGGALPGALSRDVAELREWGLLRGHIAAAPAYGAEHEALSTLGAIDAAIDSLGWDAVLVGPGPGIIGSATEFGHGGIVALDSAHAALALGLPTALSPRLSSADPRARHRHLSHHSHTVLGLLLAAVDVAVPDAAGVPGLSEARAELASAAGDRHRLRPTVVDLAPYTGSGLPTTTMGRTIDEDPLFFAAPLAAGRLLAE